MHISNMGYGRDAIHKEFAETLREADEIKRARQKTDDAAAAAAKKASAGKTHLGRPLKTGSTPLPKKTGLPGMPSSRKR